MLTKRPPIVTVLGHVDHGKTTLLDVIRKTHIADREAGGITQGIGATQIKTSEGNITFIDTPGHEAFSGMRKRGTKVADIVILVVAADDGVMPQTREAIKYLLEGKLPFIVAFTKTDLPSAQVEVAKASLEKEGVFFEGHGGQVPSVLVSAKKQEGVSELIELIQLVAEVNDIKGDTAASLEAVVIEANKDKRGMVVSAVVKNGTIKQGMEISVDGQTARARGLFDQNNRPVKSALPGDPVVILGFSSLPLVGSTISSERKTSININPINSYKTPKVGKEEVAVVLKVANSGSLEAVKYSLPKGVVVLKADVGDISETDVFFAKSSGAIILAFEVKVPNNVKKLAENEGVILKSFKIIYELSDYLKEKLGQESLAIAGKADILAIFPYNKQTVARCKVTEG